MKMATGGGEFERYELVSDMPDGVKQHFWEYVDALNKKLDQYYRDIRRKDATDQLDSTCAEFTRFMKNIPDIANARLYQKQKKCAWEIAKHYRDSGRKEPGSLLSVLGKNFASKYR